MKILITENQLEKIIHKYISKELGEITRSIPMYEIIHLRNKSGKEVGTIHTNTQELYLDNSFFDPIQNVFNLDNEKTCQYIINWIKIHWDIEIERVNINLYE